MKLIVIKHVRIEFSVYGTLCDPFTQQYENNFRLFTVGLKRWVAHD